MGAGQSRGAARVWVVSQTAVTRGSVPRTGRGKTEPDCQCLGCHGRRHPPPSRYLCRCLPLLGRPCRHDPRAQTLPSCRLAAVLLPLTHGVLRSPQPLLRLGGSGQQREKHSAPSKEEAPCTVQTSLEEVAGAVD